MNQHYDDAERFLIRRLFNAGSSDGQIAFALKRLYGRELGTEAIRKARRVMGLKKVPSYARWEWVPEGQVSL